MSNIKLFESHQIRTIWNESDQKWYFVVADVVKVLTDTPNPADYIKKMRKRDGQLSQGWGQIVTPLAVETAGGKQKLNCANAKGLLRIIQSIPSPKVGGKIAGDARKHLELKSGKRVVTGENYLVSERKRMIFSHCSH